MDIEELKAALQNAFDRAEQAKDAEIAELRQRLLDLEIRMDAAGQGLLDLEDRVTALETDTPPPEPDPDPVPDPHIIAVLHGVNIAGGEFGAVPGRLNHEYVYGGVGAPYNIPYYAGKGVKLIRLPFRWKRMQPTLHGALDAVKVNELLAYVREAAKYNILVLPDSHDYGRYNYHNSPPIGSPEVPIAAFADFWKKMATALKNEPNLYGYDLSNEPYNMNGNWKAAAQAAVDAIRTVDMSTTIVVSGDNWSGAMSWRSHSNDLHINDPADNLIYQAHQYFDKTNSGTYKNSYDADGTYPDIGVDRLKPFTDWLAEHGYRGLLGEYGWPIRGDADDAKWQEVGRRFLVACQATGVDTTYWAGGPWWGGYPLSIEPSGGVDKPQMGVLQEYL